MDFVYLLFGENRIGDTRAGRAQEALAHYHSWIASLRNIAPVNWSNLYPALEPIHKQADSLVGIPTRGGNTLELIEEPEKIIRSIINDIDDAKSTCHLQFHIWHEGGTADDVVAAAAAVIRAVKQGVTCRVLVDNIASKEFLQGRQVQTMRAAGVRVLESLPAGFFKALFVRIDIRNHYKLVVIDGKNRQE